MMTPLVLSLIRVTSAANEPCSVCGATFAPAEDSGSRLLTLLPAGQEPFSMLLCGGCHSRWSHGVTVTAWQGCEPPLNLAIRHPERG